MKKIILDTNVFMSGIFWAGQPAKILDAWQAHKINLVVSTDILNEYVRIGEALSKKYPGTEISSFIDMVALHGIMVEPGKLSTPVCRDVNDDMFIALALSSGTKLIISGDKDLHDIDGYGGIKVLKPSQFVAKYLS